MTRGDEIIQAMQAAQEKLRTLSFGPYAREDVANVVDPLGSRLESFLRATMFPTSRRQDRFVDLIARLGISGLPAADVQRLHDLRELYNTSKHAPTTPLILAEVIATCEQAAVALTAAIQLGLGSVNVQFEHELKYHLYVGFWDHYTGGETEVAVMLPSNHWTHVDVVDVFHMDIKSWDTLKPVLLTHPRFRLGQQHFKPNVWKSFSEEGDFLNAGVWEGDYGELVRMMADFDDRDIAKSILPWSRRTNNAISVGTALIIAAVDIARSASAAIDAHALAQAVIARADAEYAIPAETPLVPKAALQIASLIAALPFQRWRYLAGPALTPHKDREWPKEPDNPLLVALDGNAILLGR